MPRRIDLEDAEGGMAPVERQPDFAEEPAVTPAAQRTAIQRARAQLKAMANATAPVPDADRPDTTEPGGVYIVDGRLVNAAGEEVK